MRSTYALGAPRTYAAPAQPTVMSPPPPSKRFAATHTAFCLLIRYPDRRDPVLYLPSTLDWSSTPFSFTQTLTLTWRCTNSCYSLIRRVEWQGLE